MPKVEKGQQFPDFTFHDVFYGEQKFYQRKGSQHTILLFLRFMGCRFTQYDMMQMQKKYKDFQKKDTQVLVVVQSPVETVCGYFTPETQPMTIICDPDAVLYQKFSVLPAKTREEINTKGFYDKLKIINDTNLVKGKPEGNPLQVPAIFIMNVGNIVEYVHYGKDEADIPTPSEILELIP
ncbi:MAG: redoxin domain-containing protein [Megasphaera sp.]|nr:redoxin domain-containing protein [Megasphaera sp.]